MAVYQLLQMLNDTPLSGASPLPHLDRISILDRRRSSFCNYRDRVLTMNTEFRKPLPGSRLDFFDARAAVEAITPGAYATLP